MSKRDVRRRRKRSSPARFWLVAGAGVVVFLVVLAILIDSVAYHNKVHAGVSVAGVELGGKTKDEAKAALNAFIKEARSSSVTLKAGNRTWIVKAEDVDMTMDIDAAVKAAMARSRDRNFLADLGTRWKLYFSHTDLPLTGSLDEARLADLTASIAEQVDIPPVDAGLAIEKGTIKVIDSVDGKVVDQDSLAADITTHLLSLADATLPVPIVTKEAAVKAEDNAAAQKQAETMISGAVTVSAGGETWTITPEQIASYMGFTAETQNGVSTLVPLMDVEKLKPLLDKIAPVVREEAVNASFKHDGSKVWVVAGKNGTQLDRERTAEAITAATLRSGSRSVEASVKVLEPALTSEKAKTMGIKQRLSSYTTTYKGNADRQTNVKMATKYATNVILAPGEGYDFDKQVGPRTPKRGFKEATGIVGPGQLEDVLGGGICQVSTTMFNAVASGKAGLKIVERHNHSIYISHYPKGRDATVTAGGKNLRFVNDTKNHIWITGESNGVTTTIQVWGTDQGRKTEWTIGDFYDIVEIVTTSSLDPTVKPGQSSLVQSGQKGQMLKTTRVVTENGKVLHKNTWTNRFPMYPRKVAIGPSTTSTTTPTSTTKPPSTTTTEGPTTTEAP